MTALMFAAIVDRRDIVEMLLAAGADPAPRNWADGTALDYAYDEVAFEMISSALFPDLQTRNRKALEWLQDPATESLGLPNTATPLTRALYQTDGGMVAPPPGSSGPPEREGRVLGRVRTLLRIGANPNERVEGDRTPLSIALLKRAHRTARVLLQNGGDVNQRWCDRIRPHWAAYSSTPTKLEPLGRDPACTLDNGITPLMWSAAVGDARAVKLLLEFGADRSLKDWAGRSALHYATTREVWDLLSTETQPPLR